MSIILDDQNFIRLQNAQLAEKDLSIAYLSARVSDLDYLLRMVCVYIDPSSALASQILAVLEPNKLIREAD